MNGLEMFVTGDMLEMAILSVKSAIDLKGGLHE